MVGPSEESLPLASYSGLLIYCVALPSNEQRQSLGNDYKLRQEIDF